MSATFKAQYHGTCTKCEDSIHPGEEVQFAAFDEVIHVKCPEDTNGLVRPACTQCWTELPANGVCGTCDV